MESPKRILMWKHWVLFQLWRAFFNYVQLRYEFLNGELGLPMAVERTYVTFYDFDTGKGVALEGN